MIYGIIASSQTVITRVVESADPADLQQRLTETLAELATVTVDVGGQDLPVLVASMELGGAGDGHAFFVTITAAAIVVGAYGGLDPANIAVSAFLASEASALASVQAATLASLPMNASIVDTLFAGASGGMRGMGVLVYTEDVGVTRAIQGAPVVYDYALDAVADVVTVAIAGAGTPVLVPGTYTLSGDDTNWAEAAAGLLQYNGSISFDALVRARVAVRSTAAGPHVVRAGVFAAGAPPSAIKTQTVSVDNVLLHHVTAEAIATFGPAVASNQVGVAVANETTDDDLEVLSAQLVVKPLNAL